MLNNKCKWSRHARLGSAFALIQIELTANRLLDKLIDISLTDGLILEKKAGYTQGDHQHFQSHSFQYQNCRYHKCVFILRAL